MLFDAPLAPKDSHMLTKVRLAQEFGWTFDYIDTLSHADIVKTWAVIGAQRKAEPILRKRRKK